ncbi:MAG TPA: ornithine carbamoyltransferase [Actinomycetota bacterium]|nr:ornithine carbamoyltransferase [Actinomycetota bacterium]
MTAASERDFLSIDDLSTDELVALLTSAAEVKREPDSVAAALEGRDVALIFEKPSTRTRVSFEAAVNQMGGRAIVLRGDELQLGRGETIEDTARVLSRYVDAIVVRTFGHDRLERLADASDVPVVNSLSDYSHPCQALADMQTIQEHRGGWEGKVLTYLGDGNNVAHSLMFAGTKLGMEVRIACPEGYDPDEKVRTRCETIAGDTGGAVVVTHDAGAAAGGAEVLYTDVWASMGQEDEAEARRQVFEPYRLDASALERAAPDAIVMHCLPAHRGEEIAADVIDGPRSVVWDQAENRLHAQKALLAWLLA